MFEQDYIMRLIQEMVKVLLKLLFHLDADAPTAKLYSQLEEKETLDTLLDLVDGGDICGAENRLWEMASDGNPAALETALLFYSYLNEKTDDFLAEHDFSRQEIKEGLEGIVSRYGLGSLVSAFLADT